MRPVAGFCLAGRVTGSGGAGREAWRVLARSLNGLPARRAEPVKNFDGFKSLSLICGGSPVPSSACGIGVFHSAFGIRQAFQAF